MEENRTKKGVKKITGEIRVKQVKQIQDGSAKISLSTHNKLTGNCPEWGKIHLEKYHTHKNAAVTSGHQSMLQLLQKQTPLCVCPFANEQAKLTKNKRVNTGWRNINRKAAWKRG